MNDRKNSFKNETIQKKISCVYAFCILPILLVLCASVIIILSRVVIKNIKLSVNNNSEVIVNQIESKVQNAQSCANMVLAYLNELDFLKINNNSDLSFLSRHNQILKKMIYSHEVFNDVDSMVFFDREGNIYGNNVQTELLSKNDYPSNLLEQMNNRGGEAVWFELAVHKGLSKDNNQPVLVMGKNIVDIWTGDKLGVLFLTIDESSICDVYSQLKLSQNSYYVITNKEGKVVSSPHKKDLGSQYVIKGKGDYSKGYYSGGNFLNSYEFKKLPYHLLFQAPLMELAKDIQKILLYIVVIGSILITMAVFISSRLARKITKPIIHLSQVMKEVTKGDITIRCTNNMKDETGLIAQGLNDMLDMIQSLIINIEKEQQKERRYELALIQSQIKPHFLYNTLDTIYVLAYMGRMEDVKKTTKALADFYRIALSSGKEMITIGEEIKCIESYLKIQNTRYEEDFDYSIHVDENFYDIPILKLSIQPLVENAIYHGLREKEDKGTLLIYSKELEETICIIVEDNGVGMSKDRCDSLLEKEINHSFGIKNVYDRLYLYFSGDFDMKIESRLGEGTKVTIILPKIVRGNVKC